MFKNLHELIATMPDDATCRKFLAESRWQDGKAICPYCGYGKCYVIENGKRYKCGSSACYKKFSVTVGTVFEASNIPLNKWFMACYLVTAHKKGISSYQLARDIGVSQKASWFMIHRLRELMRDKEPVELNNTCEIDEVWIGGKMKNKHKSIRNKAHVENRSHTENKTGVMGLLERENKVVFKVIDSSKDTLKGMVRKHVNKDAVVITDSLISYKGLDKEYKLHEVVNHLQDEFVKGQYHTNSIEGAFSLLKRGIIGIYHQVSVKHLERYCDEFAFRYNSRKMKDADRFRMSLGQVEGRLDYKTLTGKK
ncbi:IS1595 family transposase [Panacibacter ginsenosidivorans]|uniref:IS1595 family transposase n=1 Tax=Panacibacter ginsenosidivorans TaxID=1813871 RepID=A0A5B8V7K8_9BACT|nr:IS1595 family transposase [Panacibacter ginsenosidivorans]QEC67249.1 IS1595 family transposase [Panacibacter ginsenosidivorans]